MDIFTIGHSTLEIEKFIYLLKKYYITCIVDVRSNPYSKFISIYNKENISYYLKKNHIAYIHMGEEFGARRKSTELYTKEGYLDFEKASNDEGFNKGVARIKNGIEYGFNIALMCSEKEPIDCHRAIMICKRLKELEFNVNHILSNGKIKSQEEIENELLKLYYPNRNQISFDMLLGNYLTNDEMIKECYRKRNKEIGFHYSEIVMSK